MLIQAETVVKLSKNVSPFFTKIFSMLSILEENVICVRNDLNMFFYLE